MLQASNLKSQKIIFISGMPRSGTKLLRDLLNNHPRISIPESETLIIPSLLNNFEPGKKLNENQIQEVEDIVLNSKFYLNLKDRFTPFTLDSSHNEITTIIEKLLDHFSDPVEGQNKLIGDKTPGYIVHLDKLINAWPNIKIIHIVRDPRDYAYSVYYAWGRSMYRAADRWRRGILKSSESQLITKNNYSEIRFEDLLENPELVLKELCKFLGVEFNKELVVLDKATENLGEAKGFVGIKRDNKNKYKQNLSPYQIRRIESIAKPALLHAGYTLEYDVEFKPLNKFQNSFLKLHDGVRSALFHISNKGVKDGIKYFIKVYRQNSVRGKLD